MTAFTPLYTLLIRVVLNSSLLRYSVVRHNFSLQLWPECLKVFWARPSPACPCWRWRLLLGWFCWLDWQSPSTKVCDIQHSDCVSAANLLSGQSDQCSNSCAPAGLGGLGFPWFIWAFQGFVLFFCILHLIGKSPLSVSCTRKSPLTCRQTCLAGLKAQRCCICVLECLLKVCNFACRSWRWF